MLPLSSNSDLLLNRSLELDGKIWTIASKFEGIDYYYLVCEDEEEPILRSAGLLHTAIFRFGQEVDPKS